jgi:hypothetical protein
LRRAAVVPWVLVLAADGGDDGDRCDTERERRQRGDGQQVGDSPHVGRYRPDDRALKLAQSDLDIWSTVPER